MDRSTWEFVNGFADWFSAFGTVLAVVVSLRLARRQFQPDVTVRLSGVILADGVTEPQSLFELRVVNRGMVDVVVAGIHATCAFTSKRLVIVPPRDELSSRVPTRLIHGETASYFYTPEQFQKTGSALKSFTPRWILWGPFRRFLKIGVYTSTGGDFMMRADVGLARMIRASSSARDSEAPR